jgi:deazaflavin-dependent oxidoreductase (nitroreductase family)
MTTTSTSGRRPGPLMRSVFAVPTWLWTHGFGRLLGHWFLLLEHTGRKTGRHYQTVLEVVARDGETGEVYAASGFGRASNWFRNLQANPHATIETAGRRTGVEAHLLDSTEREAVFARYSRQHPWRHRFFEHELGADLPLVGFRPQRDRAFEEMRHRSELQSACHPRVDRIAEPRPRLAEHLRQRAPHLRVLHSQRQVRVRQGILRRPWRRRRIRRT